MKSIKENVSNEIVIKKSKFITKLYRIYNIRDIENILFQLRKEHKDSTHICYAYILDNHKKFDDDNEPNGTAGMPILKVLEKNQLNNILCVVIRYFGGIKLGAGGLIRAYCNSASEVLNKTDIINLVPAKIIKITFDYDDIKIMDNILKDYTIVNKIFDELISYVLIVKNENINYLNNKVSNLYKSLEIKQDTFIEN